MPSKRYHRRPTFDPTPTRFPWRVAVYGIVILYLFIDLYWLGGPLSTHLLKRQQLDPVARGWVASVYGQPVTSAQLDTAVQARLFRRGHQLADYSGQSLLALKINVLEDIIQHRVLRTWTSDETIDVPTTTIDAEIVALRSAYPDADTFQATLARQGLTPGSLRIHLRDRLHQQAWIEQTIAPALEITPQEIASYFTAHSSSLKTTTGKRPTLEQASAEIHTHLENQKRTAAVASLRQQLLTNPGDKIRRYYKTLHDTPHP